MDYFVTDYNMSCPPGAECAVLEDSIMQKGRPATAGSKILENFISPIDATVVTRLEAAGIKILGKTKMDEFGAAGLFPDSAAGVSGAVSAVADGIATYAFCNDYTGAVRQQAAERGVCYIHPTYGTVSRYGLIPAVPSMDQIGIVCRTPEEGSRALSVMAGRDGKDGAVFDNARSTVDYGQWAVDIKQIRIGEPVNVFADIPDAADALELIKGFKTVDFKLEYYDIYSVVMRILCGAEISSSLTRYDGVKFGYRARGFGDLRELYTKSRTEALGPDAKLVSLLGAMALSQGCYEKYYEKAMRIRRLIKNSVKFDKYDIIVMPATGAGGDADLALHALPQLCGLPAVTVPSKSGDRTTPGSRTKPDGGTMPDGVATPSGGTTPDGGTMPDGGTKPGSGITFIAEAGNDMMLLAALKAVTQ